MDNSREYNMKAPIETIRLSQEAKDKLIALKKETGIEHWNVLCRWAFMHSLSIKKEPAQSFRELDSNIEINWRTFAGEYHKTIEAVFRHRYSFTKNVKVGKYFLLHLHRGISLITAYAILQRLDI